MKSFLKILIIALVVVSQSCKKEFLDRPPIDQLTSGIFYKTDEEIRAATGPLYNIVWFDYNDKAFLAFGEARGGNLNSNDRTAYIQFSVNATDQGTLLPGYKSFYKIAAQSNTIMRNIKGATNSSASQAVINEGLAECHFMRGMAYYFLVNNWGAVPIIYDNVGQLGNDVKRNRVVDVWEFIIRDMKFAVENLPVQSSAPGRLNKWSAKGMLARMYLTRAGVDQSGGTRDQAYLDSARMVAADVCNNSGLKLMDNYGDLFKSAFNNSDHTNPNPESLFALQWMPTNDPWGVNNSFQAYVAFSPDITQTGDGWGAAQGISADLVKYYIANPEDSIRRRATAMFNGDYYPELNQKAGGTDVTANNVAFIKKYVIGSPADNGGKGNFMTVFINTYMQRLAEVYLIYAESILGNSASTSDPEALKFFNAVRMRAGLNTYASITFDDIFQEKRVELAMEGNAWYEILRLYYFNPQKAKDYCMAQDRGNYTIDWNTGTYAPRQYNVVYNPQYFTFNDNSVYLPFPEVELSIAPGLAEPPVPFDFSNYE